MRTEQTVGLLVVVSALAFSAGLRVGEQRGARVAAGTGGTTPCCSLPATPAARRAAPVAIPTGSGRPCLVEFGSDKCEPCRRMAAVLREIKPRLKDVDLVPVDTDLHPGEAQRWHLRLVPTQLLVDAHGQERWRHEGPLSAADLLAQVRAVGADQAAPARSR